MLKRDHNSQQHDDRDKVASTPLRWHCYDKYSCLSLNWGHMSSFTFTTQSLCFMVFPLLKSKQRRGPWNKVYLPFPSFNNELICYRWESFAQLPVCCLNPSCLTSLVGEWTTELVPAGYYPIVLLLTWSMWLIVFARGCKRGGVGTAGPTTH